MENLKELLIHLWKLTSHLEIQRPIYTEFSQWHQDIGLLIMREGVEVDYLDKKRALYHIKTLIDLFFNYPNKSSYAINPTAPAWVLDIVKKLNDNYNEHIKSYYGVGYSQHLNIL